MSRMNPSSQNKSDFSQLQPASSLILAAPARRLPADPAPLPSPPLDVKKALRGEPLRILVIAAESTPYAKTGGVADVIGALPRALRRLGHDVRVALPRHGFIEPAHWNLKLARAGVSVPIGERDILVDVLETTQPNDMPVYFIDAPSFSDRDNTTGYSDDGERYVLFNRAVLEFIRAIEWAPDVIHCHDWHTGIVPTWLKTIYRNDPLLGNAATVYTIHNLQYHGIFGYRILEVAGIEKEGVLIQEADKGAMVDLIGQGIEHADIVSTVSPRYAREILEDEFGEGLSRLLRTRKDRLYGILNGIDTEQYDPATDSHITSRYDAFSLDQRSANKRALQRQFSLPVDDRAPLISMISRLNDQKGFGLLDYIFAPLLEQGAQIVVQGAGDVHYHQMLQKLAVHYPRQFTFQLTFSSEVSHRIYAGADMLLMPSQVEPCGVTQMLAMRYGAIPIVHRVGGLADTVQEFDPERSAGNGFSFTAWNPFNLFAAVVRAIEAFRFRGSWAELMQRAMLADYSWDASAEQYIALFRRAVELQRLASPRVS